MSCTIATSGDEFVSTSDPDPLGSGVLVTFALMTTAPATPAGALWMCPSVTVVPAGNPVRLATNVTDAAVMLPEPSFVVSNVIVTLPLPDASALAIGGTSLAGSSVAVNVGLVGADDDGDVDDEPQPTAMNASAIARADRRFMGASPDSR